MNCKTYILSTIVCFLSTSVFAQIEQDIIRPSINADQFSIGAKAETALTRGQLSVSIPLMELKGKGYTLPISLAFYGGDITSFTEASPIGLGWALMAGGVVTKTIKGTDDTANDNINRDHHYYDDFLDHNFYNTNPYALYDILENAKMDPMPDEYSYSLPGHSGTIDISKNGNTITKTLYPDESYRFEELENGVCITADDGTKFYFLEIEERIGVETKSASWFLSRIVTTKGGIFTFNYAKEEYVDISSCYDGGSYEKYRTNRLTSIVSDYGSITFSAATRNDRGGFDHPSIPAGYESKRINNIVLRDENGNFVKGYELNNSDFFTHTNASAEPHWTEIRLKLSSITQYDSVNNKLPPYKFEYSYIFNRPRFVGQNSNDDYLPKNSWTTNIGTHAFANLDSEGRPTSLIDLNDMGSGFNGNPPTVNDYFCLTNITYPTGATDEFFYEQHNYGRINATRPTSSSATIQGRRLSSKIRSGNEVWQQTNYRYNTHGTDYDISEYSSGILTNPSIHRATYYTPGSAYPNTSYLASKMSSERAFNSYLGTPVFYTEVEEVEMDMEGHILSRNIHYYDSTKVNPPTNYIYVHTNKTGNTTSFVEITNKIFGELHSNSGNTALFNGVNMTYLAYPVGEFCVDTEYGDQPIKEVFIGKDGRVRSIKQYDYKEYGRFTKYGYKIDKEEIHNPNNTDIEYTIFRFCKSDYNTRRYRPWKTNITNYFYNGEECDSICESSSVNYNKGRVRSSGFSRNNESSVVFNYFPDEITGIPSNNSNSEIAAIKKLIEKNIIVSPIKAINKRNDIITGGECKDYKVQAGIPLPKSIYKIKNNNNNYTGAPTIVGNSVDYNSDMYKEGEILTYDEHFNPEHVRIKDTQDRIYVWGYGGRFPIAIIDNMDYDTYNANNNLKTKIQSLSSFKRIGSAANRNNLMTRNQEIRNLLPVSAHITTFTYDPYFGITSEIDDSNSGIIYTYDSFGRLSAKYDADYKKLEDYNYNLYQPQ